MIDMLFPDTDQQNGYYDKEDEENAQGKKQVSLVGVDIFSELLEHGLVIYLLFCWP
jgi:hypothetical protein